MFEAYVTQACILVLIISGIPLLTTSVLGMLISILQAATQVQEQTAVYAVKFAAISAVLALGGGWFSAELVQFMQETLASLSFIGGL